ncbi:serine hydrolase [Bacillus cereus group sp. N21]|uniref:serine hydrolase domain-containing protein n=1 Tax=Bacillus cereus group sp. N21 TaxID=2794591 RepID=UPI0018F315DF|nr:serine hydrolase domain-containing protein [Bacillus cereus group sp. N21]MBJ8030408.1 beta-lactamase family protein [Bacillus cereus group sp. N21]
MDNLCLSMYNKENLQDKLSELSIELDQSLIQDNIPGCSIAIVLNQEIIWSHGFGYANIESKIPATAETIYRVGSVTKPFTGLMLMLLRDAGKLQLDDSLEIYEPLLKQLKTSYTEKKKLTFKMIASHISGLPKGVGYQIKDEENVKNMLEKSINAVKLVTPPWSHINYSSLGYFILGYLLAKISKQSYIDYLTEHILEPLEMNKSGFRISDPKMAVGYQTGEDGTNSLIINSDDIRWREPSNGLCSTVIDTSKFLSMQFQQNPNSLLTPTSLREMHSPVMMLPDWSRGAALSWFIERFEGHTILEHSGEKDGFNAYIGFLPDCKLGISIFLNSNKKKAKPLSRSILKALISTEENERFSKRILRLNQLLR